jgi:hypothetical protein
MVAPAGEFEVVRCAGHAQHHPVEALVVPELTHPDEAQADRVEAHDLVELIGGPRDA